MPYVGLPEARIQNTTTPEESADPSGAEDMDMDEENADRMEKRVRMRM